MDDSLVSKWAALWESSARAGLASAQAMMSAAGAAAQTLLVDPVAVSTQAQRLFASFVTATLHDLPSDAFARLAALGYGGASGAPSPAPSFDPSTEPAGLRALLDEYARDLGALPDDAFAIDLAPLSAAVVAVLAGQGDARQQAMVRDFMAALAVKARLGPEVYVDPATTPTRTCRRDEVLSTPDLSLMRYERSPDRPARGEPVLIVYSVINRSYILDLLPGGSFVQHLLDADLDVFLVEWAPIDPEDGERSLERALATSLPTCLDRIEELTGHGKVALFGHCIGGTFAAMLAALRPDRVARLLLLTTPFRAAEEGVVSWLTDPRRFPVAEIVGQHGRMPAKLIRHTFLGLKPYYELTKWRLFIDTLGDEEAMARFAALDRWSNDNVDVPAEVFRPFVQDVLQSERLLRGEVVVAGETLDLRRIEGPVLNVFGKNDWIVRPDAARALAGALSEAAELEELELPGGHLSLLLDGRLRPHWTRLSDFLRGVEGAP